MTPKQRQGMQSVRINLSSENRKKLEEEQENTLSCYRKRQFCSENKQRRGSCLTVSKDKVVEDPHICVEAFDQDQEEEGKNGEKNDIDLPLIIPSASANRRRPLKALSSTQAAPKVPIVSTGELRAISEETLSP